MYIEMHHISILLTLIDPSQMEKMNDVCHPHHLFSGYMSGTEGQGGATPTMLQYLQLLQGGLLEAMFNTGTVKFGLGDHAPSSVKDGISIMLASNPQKFESVG
jgi:hypothetical protein